MARKKKFDRQQRPPPGPSPDEVALAEAVAGAFAALGSGVTASEVERWVKANHFNVWLRVTAPSVLIRVVEAEREKLKATQPKGANGMARRKKEDEKEPEQAKPSTADNDREEAPAKPVSAARESAPAEPARKRARHSQPGRGVRPATTRSPASGQRAKRKEANGNAASPPPPRPYGRAGAAAPTVEDLRRVRSLAVKEGGIAELRKTVQRVARLADQVGGLHSLATCLDVLEEFGVK